MPRLRTISKKRQRYLKIVYQIPGDEDPDKVYPEEDSLPSCLNNLHQQALEEPEEIALSGDQYETLPEGCNLIGVLPNKRLLQYSSRSGFFLNEEDTGRLTEEIVSYAWERLVRYLTYRERSIAECRTFLSKLPVNEEIINDLLNRAVHKKYLDEERFAELLAQSYISRHKSRRELKTALISKRIPEELISKVVNDHYTTENRKEIIRYHIKKGIRKYPDKGSYHDYQKCIAYLMRKGFSFDDFFDELQKYYRSTDIG